MIPADTLHMPDSVLPSCDCQVCLVPHDDEIHEATLNLHRWFRSEVTKYFFDDIPVEDDDPAVKWYLVA